MRKKLKPLNKQVRGVNINGEDVKYDGEFNLEFKCAHENFRVKAFYSPQITYGIVLGLDFMKKYGAIIDFKTKTIGFHKEQSLSLPEDVIIPPRSEITTHFPITTPQRALSTAAVKANFRTLQKGLLIANAIVAISPSVTTIPVRILNIHDHSISLQKNKHYAHLTFLHRNDSCYPMNDNKDYEKIRPKASQVHISHKKDEVRENQSNINRKVYEEFTKHFNFQNSVLTEEQQKELLHLCFEYKDCFHVPGSKLKATHLTKYTVRVSDDYTPIKARPYRMSPPMQAEMKKQTDQMLKDGWIKRAVNPEFASPSLLVQKKQNQWRMVIDYRLLNKYLKDTACTAPNPNIADAIDAVGNKKPSLFIICDLSSAFTQIKTDATPPCEVQGEQDSTQQGSADKYLSFVTPDGIFTPLRAPQGTATIGQRFIETLHKAVGSLSPEHLFLYVDDIILFGSDFEGLYKSLQLFLEKLKTANLQLAPHKSTWGAKSVKFLGFILSDKGLKPDPKKTEAIANMERPRTAKETKRFNGMVSFYRRFVKDHSKISRCLHEITKPSVKFEWTTECQEAFDELKERLTNAPILAYAQYDRPFIMKTDASNTAIGHELLQIQDDGHPHPILYGSRSLSKHERNWSVTMKELLAVVWSVKHNISYLRGTKFKIITDHAALVPILKGKVSDCTKINRYAIFLSQFDFEIEYISGKSHIMSGADFLSRLESYAARIRAEKEADDMEDFVDETILPTEGKIAEIEGKCSETKLAAIRTKRIQPKFLVPDHPFTVEQLREEQEKDEFTSSVMNYLEKSELPDCDRRAREILLTSDRFVITDGLLHRLYDEQGEKHRQTSEMRICLCLPKSLVPLAIQEIHNNSHQGIYRTYLAAKLKYFFPSMHTLITRYVKSCEICAARKHQTHPNKHYLHPLPPARIFERMAVDLIPMIPSKCPNNPTYDNQRWILTCIDHGTRYLEAMMLPDAKSTTIATAMLNEIFLRYGTPSQILSDLGRNLTGSLMKEVCDIYRIQRVFTGAYTPTVNSLLELSNYHLVKTMGMLMQGRPHTEWPLYLKHATYSLNCSFSQGIAFVPYYLVFSRLPVNYLDTIIPETKENLSQDARGLITRVMRAREASMANLKEAQDKMKKRFDASASPITWTPGDLCFAYFPEIIAKDGIKKMKRIFSGPFIIVEKIGKLNYKLAHAHNGELLSAPVHEHRLKPFTSRDPSMMPEPSVEDDKDHSPSHPITDLHPHDIDRIEGNTSLTPNDAFDTNDTVTIPSYDEAGVKNVSDIARTVSRLWPALTQSGTSSNNRDQPTSVTTDPAIVNHTEISANNEDNSQLKEGEYEIEKVTKVKIGKGGKKSYLVHWKGYDASESCYVPYKDLNEAAKEYVKSAELPIIGKRNAKKK